MPALSVQQGTMEQLLMAETEKGMSDGGEVPLGRLQNESQLDIKDIDNLKKLTDSKVIEIASGDIVDHIQDDEFLLDSIGKKPGTYYRDLIFALIQIRLPEEEAKHDWKEILKHKYILSERLGRNVGIHVASLDYFTNVKKQLAFPKIVDAHEYVDTASRAIVDELTKAYNRRFFD